MGFAENRGDYWRGRYKIAPGRYGTVADATGATIKFDGKRRAKQAADAEESKVRSGTWRDPASGRMAFGTYATRWYAAQDLAASTMQGYRLAIETHLLPAFQDQALGDILTADVEQWVKAERERNYAESSIRQWRSILHLILADAVDEQLIPSNPASKRRGRGKRAGRSSDRGPEKAITDPLGALLVAERAALLAGRDDEFVAVTLLAYTGLRWGELVGLEAKRARLASLRIEAQLYELDTGELHPCPPKDDSYRDIDLPPWLSRLLSDHIARTGPAPCPCHGRTFVFRGLGSSNGASRAPGAKLVDVARRAGVSAGTVSTVLNHPDRAAELTRARVEQAVKDLGFVRGGTAVPAAHWRRNGFATWLFTPAASGQYPPKAPQPARPVPVLGSPWPGVPARGRGAAARADACWAPIARGLTPHGLRHSHKTRMRGLGTPPKLMDSRLGHSDGSVQAVYDHVTAEMRQRLMDGLTEEWEAALDARAGMAPASPVTVLDELLTARARRREADGSTVVRLAAAGEGRR